MQETDPQACACVTPRRRAINPARVDLVSMHLVLACAARGSISAAARHCHLSVMAASERLRRLEDVLGKPLFHRHRHGLEPTQAGLAALRAANVMVQALQQLADDVEAASVGPATRGLNHGRRGKTVAPVISRDAACDGLAASKPRLATASVFSQL